MFRTVEAFAVKSIRPLRETLIARQAAMKLEQEMNEALVDEQFLDRIIAAERKKQPKHNAVTKSRVL